ncbi:hypothetical protein DM860_007888 [Cuscuta australis]|uniref:Fatty acid hydroxylase domain-containing protein n=1 Tax=Cuscuta australis TaxID=267555 RepID=A0A328DWU8_9ASTE|nr:hypothetical protein DM860_007888 [Cuscuta australis]
MVAQEFTVDLNKPLVFQVGHLGEAYEEWVHQPIASREGPRFFESDFWEFLTRTVWWVIPVVWLPVVCWFVSISLRMGHTVPHVAQMVALGIFIWTLIEYILHRFLFHIKTKSYWANTFHYLIHGCHHKHPMDGLRLVFPPAAAAVLCVPFWNMVKFFSTPSTTPALFGGGLLGYVMYDVTHYYLHHGQPISNLPRSLKASEHDFTELAIDILFLYKSSCFLQDCLLLRCIFLCCKTNFLGLSAFVTAYPL